MPEDDVATTEVVLAQAVCAWIDQVGLGHLLRGEPPAALAALLANRLRALAAATAAAGQSNAAQTSTHIIEATRRAALAWARDGQGAVPC